MAGPEDECFIPDLAILVGEHKPKKTCTFYYKPYHSILIGCGLMNFPTTFQSSMIVISDSKSNPLFEIKITMHKGAAYSIPHKTKSCVKKTSGGPS